MNELLGVWVYAFFPSLSRESTFAYSEVNFISPLFILHTCIYSCLGKLFLICTYRIIKLPLKFGGRVKKSTTVKQFMLSYWNEKSRKLINIGENPDSLWTCVLLLSCTMAFAVAKKIIKYFFKNVIYYITVIKMVKNRW